jgi:hypothetical protein
MIMDKGNGALLLPQTRTGVLSPPEDIVMQEGAPHPVISQVYLGEDTSGHKPNEALVPQPPNQPEDVGEAAQPNCVDGVLTIHFMMEEQALLNKHRESAYKKTVLGHLLMASPGYKGLDE